MGPSRKTLRPPWGPKLVTGLCEALYRSFIRAPVGTDSDRAASSLLSWLHQKKQDRWGKLPTPSTFHTLAARRREQPTNLLACLDAPLTCAPSRQIPSPRNSWRTGHTGQAAASPPGSSASSCPTYGRFQHLRVTVSPNPLGQRSMLLTSNAWNQESHGDWIPSSRSLYSTPGRLSNLAFATLLHAPTQTSKDLEKSTSSCDPKRLSQKSHWGTQRAIILYLCCASCLKSSRDSSTLHRWARLGLDWIHTKGNFIKFGLHPACNSL